MLRTDCHCQHLAHPLMSGTENICPLLTAKQQQKIERSKDPGLCFYSGVPCIIVSTLSFPVCSRNKTKQKRRRKGSSKYCLVLHFPFCFLIRVSMACEHRENLKRLCSLQISAKLDVYQHLSPAHSLSGGFKDQGDLSALF